MINTQENKLRTIIKTEIRKILNEDSSSTIYKLEGKLTTDTKDRNQTDILSDIRSITGVTIVGSKDIDDKTSVDNNYYISLLTVKIDPHPYIGKGGFGKEQIIDIIKDIKRIKGVRNFNLTKSPTRTTN